MAIMKVARYYLDSRREYKVEEDVPGQVNWRESHGVKESTGLPELRERP